MFPLWKDCPLLEVLNVLNFRDIQAVSFVERSIILCPYLGGSIIGGSTLLIYHVLLKSIVIMGYLYVYIATGSSLVAFFSLFLTPHFLWPLSYCCVNLVMDSQVYLELKQRRERKGEGEGERERERERQREKKERESRWVGVRNGGRVRGEKEREREREAKRKRKSLFQ